MSMVMLVTLLVRIHRSLLVFQHYDFLALAAFLVVVAVVVAVGEQRCRGRVCRESAVMLCEVLSSVFSFFGGSFVEKAIGQTTEQNKLNIHQEYGDTDHHSLLNKFVSLLGCDMSLVRASPPGPSCGTWDIIGVSFFRSTKP